MPSLANYKLPLRAIAVIFAGTSVTAFAVTTDFGRFETKVTAREDYDSNIFLNSSAVRDFISTGDVQVQFIRDVGIVSSQVTAGAEASVYQSHPNQNTFDPFVTGGLTYTPSDKTIVAGTASLARTTLANEQVNDRTRSNNLDLDGTLQNLFSEKLGYRVGAGYHVDRYLTVGYSDVLSYNATLDAVYQYSPKLTMLAGYNYRQSWIEDRAPGTGNPASRDNRFYIGFEGDLAAKVTGSFNVGGVSRRFDSFGFHNDSGLYLQSSLKWVPAEKTTVSLTASQDFDTTAASQSSKAAMVSLGLTQVLDKQWTWDVSGAYTHAEYQGIYFRQHTVQDGARTDNNYRAKTRLTYALATNVSVEASIGLGRVDSTNDFSTYHRLNVGLGIIATF